MITALASQIVGFGNGSVKVGGRLLENGFVIRVYCTYMEVKLQQRPLITLRNVSALIIRGEA
jgi:hypothetical protein